MAQTQPSDVSAVIEQVVSTVVTETLIQESVVLGAVRDYSSLVTEGMDRLDIPLFNELAVQSVPTTGDMTPQTINPTASMLDLDQHKSIPFSIGDKASVQAKARLVQEAVSNGARSLAADIDDYMLGLVDAGVSAAAPDHRLALTGGDPLADIRMAKKVLDDQKVPRSERFIVASPGFIAEILGTNNLIRANEYGSASGIQAGFVTDIYGFRILESSSSSIIDDGFHAFHMSALAFARQISPKFENERRVLGQRNDYALSHLFGGILTDGKRGVVFDADGM